ncbi:gliding motility-associated C-terminal domain-containing protein [Flavobacteriales bacterium AH-315-E23]|nr:gliding motility-associated C-terminal domain-containing protein [Flavobacteriales bacterium AH-315-E23]
MPGGSTDSAITGLCPGTYRDTIRDFTGCFIVDSATITEPPDLTLSITDSTNITCNGLCDGDATVTPSGGTPPYTYSWSTGPSQTDSTVGSLCADSIYQVIVTDFNGCQDSITVVLSQPAVLVATIIDSSNITCTGLCDGDATVGVAGGTTPYTYAWNNAPFFDTDTLADTLCAGTPYKVIVTDSNNCQDSTVVTLSEPAVLTANITDSTNISCNGLCDGDATVTAGGGSGTYTFSWSNSDNTAQADTLCASTLYNITVTDSLGCQAFDSVTLSEPAVLTAAVTDSTNISCTAICDGTATVTAGGGTTPYTYAWDNTGPDSTAIADSLCANTVYHVTLIDSQGCQAIDSVTLSEPTVLTVAVTDSTNILCNSVCEGTATATAGGGTTPYTYAWDNIGPDSTAIADSLCANTVYHVTVIDSQGCLVMDSVTLSEPTALTGAVTDSSNALCNSACDGTATVTAGGGTTPYTYAWDNTGPDSTTIADSLCAGIVYHVTVIDSQGCQVMDSVTLSEPTVLTAAVTDSTNISCNGVCDGTATVTAGGGSGTYTYSWDNVGPDSTTVADSLCAGIVYQITVLDSLGCLATDSVTLAEPAILTVVISDSTNISCKGACNGTATGAASGGTAPYTYSWSNGDADTLADSLCANVIHTVTVTDSMSCMDSVQVTLSEPDSLFISIFDSVNISCFGVCDGIGRTTTTGGTPSYTYTWSLSADTLDSAVALCADTMNIVTVTDSNGCTAQDSVMLSQPPQIFASITDSTDASCFSFCDGQAIIDGSGGTPPLSFIWQSLETNDTAIALCADSNLYGVVIDSIGCTDTAFFSISQPTEVVTTFTDSAAALCNGTCEGTATVSISGGFAPYSIQWNNTPDNDTGTFADSLCAGFVMVTVTDSIGCIDIDSIDILEPTVFVIDTVSTTAAACDSTCDAMAVVFGTGAVPPYTFTWNDSGPTVNDTAINLCASTYIVTGTDSNGCTATDTIVILGPDSLTSSIADTTMVSCFGACDGSATVRGFGGVGAYTYSWIDTALGVTFAGPGPGDSTVTGLCGGKTYFAVIRDANNCITTVPVFITEPAPLAPNICDTNNVTCNAACDGDATACPLGGTAPYTYIWSNGDTDSIAVNLCAGIYRVTVTDANKCIAIDSLIVIAQPDLLSCSFTNAGATGCGLDSAIGFAVVQGNGGTPPYNYLWNTVSPSPDTADSVGNLLAGIYNVLVTDNNGCQNVCAIAITDTSDMAAAITDSTMNSCNGVCDGAAVVTATGSTQPYSYNWLAFDSTQIGQTDDTASGLCAGFYRAIVKSAAACFRSIPVTITQPDTLVAVISDTLNTLCNADSNGRLVVAPTGGTLPYTYAWFDTSWTQLDTLDTLFNLPAGQYCVVVTDSNGCSDTSCATVTEPDTLTVTGIDTIQPACSDICDGLVVAGASGGTTPYAYLWLPDSVADDSLSNACVDTFIITVTDTNGCVAMDTVILSPVIQVNANAGADTQICEGDSVILIGSGGSSYQWYLDIISGTPIGSDDTLITTPSVTGSHIYLLLVGDSTCSDTDSVAVYIVPVNVDAGPDQTIALGECADLMGLVTNGVTYTWTPVTGLNDPNIFNPEACPLESTTYYLTAMNDSNCWGSDSLVITVQPDIPDGFTPQGDGFNDLWEIALLNNYPNAEVQVYNRWGQLIFDSPKGQGYAVPFDGTYNGKDLPVGTYYFVIKLNDVDNTAPITGPLTIMR